MIFFISEKCYFSNSADCLMTMYFHTTVYLCIFLHHNANYYILAALYSIFYSTLTAFIVVNCTILIHTIYCTFIVANCTISLYTLCNQYGEEGNLLKYTPMITFLKLFSAWRKTEPKNVLTFHPTGLNLIIINAIY